MKPVLIVLGLGTIVVGLAGIRATPWLGWLDIAIGFVSFFVAAGVPRPSARPASARAAPIGLGGVLIVLWVIGLATGANQVLAWWTFALGIAYLLSASTGLPAAPGRGPRA